MNDETKLTRYEVGFHSDDAGWCHVTKVKTDAPEGSRSYPNDAEDIFDVQLYDPDVTEPNGRSARDNSLTALEGLVELANEALAAREAAASVAIVVWIEDGEPNAQAYKTREAAERDFIGATIIESEVRS